MPHRHYVAAAQRLEALPSDGPPEEGMMIKTFYINDRPNRNAWQVTWEGVLKSAHRLPGTLVVRQPDGRHPALKTQDDYGVGVIVDYELDEDSRTAYAYARITDPRAAAAIAAGTLEYVSASIMPEDLREPPRINGVETIGGFIPLHHCIVDVPAYGEAEATVSHYCDGDAKKCLSTLRDMTSVTREAADEGCVSRKIRIIKGERPSISDEQAAAIAYSMCRRGTASSPADPRLARRLEASLARAYSEIGRMKHGMAFAVHGGREGTWIRAKGQDVFVARGQALSAALREQCGCDSIS